jgi:hypothetical protein
VLEDAGVESPFGTCVLRDIARGWRRVAFDKKCGSFVDIQ